MNDVKNILLPIDGSDYSKRALGFAISFAKKFEAKVILLNIYELPIPITGYPYANEILNNIESSLKEVSEKILADASKELSNEKIENETILSVGDAGLRIVEIAETNKCDLIIMGSRGLNGIKEFLIGSVSNYVLHHTKTPVLLTH